MARIYFLLLIICLSRSPDVYGQTKFSLSAGVGVSSVTLRGNRIIDDLGKRDVRINFAVIPEFAWQNWLFDVPVSVESKGCAFKDNLVTDNDGNIIGIGTAATHLNYIVIAPRIGRYFGEQVKLGIRTGPFVGFLLNHKHTGNVDGVEYITREEHLYEKTHIGLSSAISMSFPLGRNWGFDLLLCNQLGLSNISDRSVIDNGTLKTNSFSIMAMLKRTF